MFDEAVIGMEIDGKIKAVHVKAEGTLSCTGALLFDYYQNPEKIKKLVNGPVVMRIGKELQETESEKDVCVYMGENEPKPESPYVYADEQEMYRKNFLSEYFYIYSHGNWFTFDHNGPSMKNELGQALEDFYYNLGITRPENFYATLTSDLIYQLKESKIAAKWPVGTIVCAQFFENSYSPIKKGTIGRVTGVDRFLRLSVSWQNGMNFPVDPEMDSFIVINTESPDHRRKEDYQMKTSVYHNLGDGEYKKAYVGYTKSQSLSELISEFRDYPLPGTYQGEGLKDGDVISVEEKGSFLDRGNYVYEKGNLLPTSFDPTRAQEMDGVRVLMMQPGMKACETRLVSSLKSLQMAVSDHREPSLIEYSYPYPDDCMILGNEEAKLINMPLNRSMNGEIYAGPIFVVKDDNYGNLKDITDEDVSEYMEKVGEPGQFNDMELDNSPYLKYFGYYE